MKKLLVGLLSIIMMSMSGCGGGTVEVYIPVEPVASPPSITSYQFTKDQVTEYIDGSLRFYAPDSDIYSITTVVFDSRGYEISRIMTLLSLTGVSEGTIPFSIDYVTYPADRFTFSIYITDYNGYTSEQIVDTFWVP